LALSISACSQVAMVLAAVLSVMVFLPGSQFWVLMQS